MEPGLLVGFVALHLLLAGIEQHRGASGLLVDAEDGFVLPIVLALGLLPLCLHLEVGLHESPLHVVTLVGGFHLPDVSAGLTVVVVAELQSPCGGCQDAGLGSCFLDEPLLVGVSGFELPGEHFAFLSAVVAVVECDV